MPCTEVTTQYPCDQTPVPPNDPCNPNILVVCGVEYAGVNDAWQKTGIPPHKLRYMARTPSFTGIYWAS